MGMNVGELTASMGLNDREFNTKIDAAHRKFGGLGSAIQSTGAKIGAGLVAFGIGKWLAGSIDVVHQYEITIGRLKTVVEATGGSWDVYSKKMKDVVDKQSQISAFSGGELRGSLADLTQITGDGSKALNLLGLTSDLARGKQMDLATASKLVGKVAMGNYGVLARYGIIIAQGTSATDALAQLQARFAGQAKAYGDTSAGAQDKLSNALKKLQLTVGTAVVPALTTLAGILVVVLNHFNSLPGPVKTVVVGIAALATAAALLAPFVGTIKGIVLAIRGMAVAAGLIPGKVAKNVIAEEAETVAVTEQTVAIEANTVARAENALMGGGSVAGIGKGALPLGAAGGTAAGAGLATGTGLITPVLIGVAATVATAFLAKYAMSGEVSQNLKNINAAGIHSQGRMAGSVAYSASGAAANQAAMAPINRAWKEFAVIAQKIKDAKPGAGDVGELDRYKDELTKLEKKYPVVAEQADKLKGALGKSASAFDAAAQAATDAAEAIRTQFGSMADFMTGTMNAAIMGTPLPTASQAAFASQSSQATAFGALTPEQQLQMYNANRRRLGLSTISGHAEGYVKPETATTSKPKPAAKTGDTHVHFNGPVVGGKAGMRELADMVAKQVMQGVRRGLVGQNA